MAGILSGKFLWVVDVDDCGGVDKVVSVAQYTRYGILAKFHDGDPADDGEYGFQEKFAELLAKCGPLGIPVVAWGYCYGDAYGALGEEVEAAAKALKSGAQAYVIDAEIEWEVRGSDRWAARFMRGLLDRVPGAEVGLTTFWNLRWHGRFPAREFWANGCSVAMPQVYYRTAKRSGIDARVTMHAISEEDFWSAGYSCIYPVGELSSDIADTLDFLSIAGDKPHSFWLLDGFQDSLSVRVLGLSGRPRKPPGQS